MIKTDFRNMSDNKKFRRKNRANLSQSGHFCHLFFFQKTTVFVEKRKTLVILHSKNKCAYKFHVSAIKSALGNMSEINDFSFKNSLNLVLKIKSSKFIGTYVSKDRKINNIGANSFRYFLKEISCLH